MSDDGTPSANLAALTIDQLIGAGLVRADKRDAVIAKVATGQMRGEDWRLEIDLGSEKAGEV